MLSLAWHNHHASFQRISGEVTPSSPQPSQILGRMGKHVCVLSRLSGGRLRQCDTAGDGCHALTIGKLYAC